MSNLREECGVFGIYGRPEDMDLAACVYHGLYALQHRGQESCGIAVNNDGIITCHTDSGLVNDVFTKEALSQKGMPGLRQNLKLLCDDDIISYIKNENTTRIGEQFFSRNARLKPLWKTEATFEHLVGKSLTPELLGEITEDFRGMSDYIQNSGAFFINEDLLKTLTESLEQKQGAPGLESYSRILEMCQLFRAFTKEYRLEKFEYILIFTNKFQSAYKKVGIKETYVQLESGVVLLEEVLSVRAKEAAHDANKTLFYVYTAAENVQNDPNLGAKFIDFLRRNYRLAQSP